MTCRKCLAPLVAHGGDGFVTCAVCGEEVNPPPIVPDSRWPVGGQPRPNPPKPKSGPRDALPPPSAEWRGKHVVELTEAQIAQRAAKKGTSHAE